MAQLWGRIAVKNSISELSGLQREYIAGGYRTQITKEDKVTRNKNGSFASRKVWVLEVQLKTGN